MMVTLPQTVKKYTVKAHPIKNSSKNEVTKLKKNQKSVVLVVLCRIYEEVCPEL